MLYEKKRNYWFIILMIVTLLANAVMVTPVLADDGVPPQSEGTENVVLPGETASPEETPMPTGAEPEEISTEAPTVMETTSSQEETSVAEVLAEVPENTNVVVLNEAGESVPLATQEAAQVVYNGDPIWCPAGVAVPLPNKNGCSPSFGRFNGADGLLAWLQANDPGKDGTVWIENTYDSATANNGMSDGNVLFNGNDLTNMAKFALTLKGGWQGAGTGSINGASIFTGNSLGIVDWKGSVTLSDIVITNATTAANGCNSALCVKTEGAIKLEEVVSNSNDGTLNGAQLDNTSSMTSSSVTVVDSSFSSNAGGGLFIDTDGAVTLKNISAIDNVSDRGVQVDNIHDLIASSVSIIKSTFNNNGNDLSDAGLFVLSNGSITLTNVLAEDNWGSGASLNNSAGTANVTLTDTNAFNNNGQYGLYLISKGSVIAKHLIANHNFNVGALIGNQFSPGQKAVTISGSGHFNNNGGDGLFITSSGTVTLANVTATSNEYGVFINNIGQAVDLAAAVKINGTNNFSENAVIGLYVTSDGAITVSNLTANTNGADGVVLENFTPDKGPQGVTLLGYLNAIDNTDVGLHVVTQGSIKASNLNASHNGEEGVILDNSFALTPKDVTISGQNSFTYNEQSGLVIESRGAVTLNNITAIGNGRIPDGNGGYIGGEYIGLYVNNAYDPAVQKDVILKGNNVFNANGMHGLQIQSYGAIQLSNVAANGNGFYSADYFGNGVSLQNKNGIKVKPVTLSGVNLFENNDENGLFVFSDGTITVSNVTATYNGRRGVLLDNVNDKTSSKISILGYGIFDENLAVGLLAVSNGAITTNNLTANFNGNGGVYLWNFGTTGPQAVTVNGTNSFIHNGFLACSIPLCTLSGLSVQSDGNITVNNVTANDNHSGVSLINDDTAFVTQAGSVVIKGYANTSGNVQTGLFVKSKGNATLNHVNANSNGTIFGEGITLLVDGNVTLACSNASNNVGPDLLVSDSTFTLPAKSITLSTSFLYSEINLNGTPATYKPCP